MTDETGSTGSSGADPAQGYPPPPPTYQPPPPPYQGQPPTYQQPAPGYQQPPAYQAPPPGYQAPPPGYQQPPTPPGYQTPPSYAPGGPTGGFDPKSLQNFDPKSVNPLDWGIMAAGLLAFIFSTFGYYKYSIDGYSGTVSAWHGFFGWFATLLSLAAAVVLAVNLIAKITLPFPVRLGVLGAFALALLCTLLALVVIPGNTYGTGVHKGHGFGYWLCLIVILAGTGLSYVRFTQSGGKLPGRP